MTGWRRSAGREPRRSRGRGLTLVELLIILGVLALVAVVLFPALAQARSRARMSACSSNFQQYRAAFLMYAQDYDQTLPMWSVDAPYRPGELDVTTWDLLLQPYLKSGEASRCPSDPLPAFFAFKDGTTVWRSYTVPRNLLWNPGDRSNPRDSEFPMKLSAVPQLGATLLLLEKNQGAEVNGVPYPRTRRPSASWTKADAFENSQQVAWERHGDRVNALFVDGHVTSLHGRRPGSFRYPAEPRDRSFIWPRLRGYVYKDGAGALLARDANGDQFWQDCPIPGERPTKPCH
jgi:prepilin-type processing-associated H-X9-DG protein